MFRRLLVLAIALTLATEPVHAENILRDAETEAFFRDATRGIALAAGLEPKSIQIVLVGDESINAAAVGNQNVIVNTGTIEAMDDVGELQGVLAHEFGHIAGGHIVRYNEGLAPATKISILSLLLGVAAIAAGAGELGAGILAGGQQAALGKYLAFSRQVESSADQAGASYLTKAGISGKGMLRFFEVLLNQEYRYGESQKGGGYDRTHPLDGERIAALQTLLQASPSWNKPVDPALQARFLRIKGKLIGFIQEPPRVIAKFPETDQSEAAHYARAYAYHRGAYPDKAVSEIEALLAARPDDPYYLELKGQILLESGRPRDAIAPLRRAVAGTRNDPLIATTLGHALIATEDKAYYPEAEGILKSAVNRDDENPFAWYQLGVIYEARGDEPRAALATAERMSLEGNAKAASGAARTAMLGLSRGTPDWIRAQDIALVTGNELKKGRR